MLLRVWDTHTHKYAPSMLKHASKLTIQYNFSNIDIIIDNTQ